MTKEEMYALLMQSKGGVPAGTTLPMSPAMNTSGLLTDKQYADEAAKAAYDPSGKEAQLAQLMRGGQEALMNTGPAPGKQMGNIYRGPTWSEIMANAVKQGLGGYQMGQARKGQQGIEEERGAAMESAARIAADERARKEAESQYDRDVSDQQLLMQRQKMEEDTAARIAQQEATAAKRAQAQSNFMKTFAQREEMQRERLASQEARAAAKAAEKKRDYSVQGLNEDQLNAIDRLGSSKERETARMLINTAQRLETLAGKAKEVFDANGNWSSGTVDTVSELAGNLTGTDAARNLVKRAYSVPEKQVRTMATQAVEDYRRAKTGANLTGVEIRVGEDWDPTAPGIGPEESLRRVVALNEAVQDALGTMGVPYSSPVAQKDKEDIPTVDLSTKPIEEMTDEELEAYVNG